MNSKEKEMVDALVKLEPVFIKAGKYALSRQKNIGHTVKHDSGSFEVDVVTEADRETQEIILKEMAKTSLVNCHLIAEEDTPLVKKFKTSGNIYLTLDPIDGTALYIRGKRFWSVLIGLHNDKEMLYTFNYCPKVGWTTKIVGNNYKKTALPEINLKRDPSKVIVHTYGSTDIIDRDIYNELIKEGYTFHLKTDFSNEAGGGALFLTNNLAGYFIPNPGAYDGLQMYHYGKAMGYKIISSGPDGEFRIDRFIEDHGLTHPGYYIVLKN